MCSSLSRFVRDDNVAHGQRGHLPGERPVIPVVQRVEGVQGGVLVEHPGIYMTVVASLDFVLGVLVVGKAIVGIAVPAQLIDLVGVAPFSPMGIRRGIGRAVCPADLRKLADMKNIISNMLV